MRLLQVVLFVKDTPRMRAFYTELLGLTPCGASEGSDVVRLDAGGVVVVLHPIPPAIAATIVVTDPPTAREETPLKLTFQADHVAATRARLVAGGASMGPLRSHGARVWCDGVDPEGNVFQVAST